MVFFRMQDSWRRHSGQWVFRVITSTLPQISLLPFRSSKRWSHKLFQYCRSSLDWQCACEHSTEGNIKIATTEGVIITSLCNQHASMIWYVQGCQTYLEKHFIYLWFAASGLSLLKNSCQLISIFPFNLTGFWPSPGPCQETGDWRQHPVSLSTKFQLIQNVYPTCLTLYSKDKMRELTPSRNVSISSFYICTALSKELGLCKWSISLQF